MFFPEATPCVFEHRASRRLRPSATIAVRAMRANECIVSRKFQSDGGRTKCHRRSVQLPPLMRLADCPRSQCFEEETGYPPQATRGKRRATCPPMGVPAPLADAEPRNVALIRCIYKDARKRHGERTAYQARQDGCADFDARTVLSEVLHDILAAIRGVGRGCKLGQSLAKHAKQKASWRLRATGSSELVGLDRLHFFQAAHEIPQTACDACSENPQQELHQMPLPTSEGAVREAPRHKGRRASRKRCVVSLPLVHCRPPTPRPCDVWIR